VISGRWKATILYHVFGGPQRLSELQPLMPGVSEKGLIQLLREMEEHGIVHREAFRERKAPTEKFACLTCSSNGDLGTITNFACGDRLSLEGRHKALLFILAEPAGDESCDCLHCLRRLNASGTNGDGHSWPGTESQYAHDRGSADGFPTAANRDSRIEPVNALDELCRCACMKPLPVNNFKGLHEYISWRL
jgi:HxlR-like helix-turn-helix